MTAPLKEHYYRYNFRTDHLGNINADCPRVEQLRRQIEASQEFQKLEEENRAFLDYIGNKTGREYNLSTIYELDDIVYIEVILTQMTLFIAFYGTLVAN